MVSKVFWGQVYTQRGLKVGLVYEIGQPVHRIGGSIGFHANVGIFQISSNNVIFYAFKNYGPLVSRIESQSGATLGIGFGSQKTTIETLAMLSPLSNYSLRNNMISYGIKFYTDKIGTEQVTGLVSVRLGNYFIASENDGFAFLPFDRYRTGAISVGRYFFSANAATDLFRQHRVSADILLYTGQTQGEPTQKITEGNYPSRFGYKKLNESKYHNASHGILKFSWCTSLVARQNGFVNIGLDNEKIRNTVQNKLIHDLPFLPQKLIKIKNPHIPMRNTEGSDYLYRKNEKIRKGRFVWGLGLNRPLFY